MAALYGRLQGNRGQATRCGSRHITTTAETWQGQVTVQLEANGDFRVVVGDKGGGEYAAVILSGNVGDDGDRRVSIDRADGDPDPMLAVYRPAHRVNA